MTKFDFSREQISIVNDSGHCVDLSPQEALELLQWLSDKRATLLRLISSQNKSQQDSARREMEILIQPVTEYALQLLEVYQIEYHLHPLLEDNSEFAQG